MFFLPPFTATTYRRQKAGAPKVAYSAPLPRRCQKALTKGGPAVISGTV